MALTVKGIIDAFRSGYSGDEFAEWDEFAALAYQEDEEEVAKPWVLLTNADSNGNANIRRFKTEEEARERFEQLRADAIAWGIDVEFENFAPIKEFGRGYDREAVDCSIDTYSGQW